MAFLRRKAEPECVGCVDLPEHGNNWERRIASAFKAILGTASLRSLWAPACKAKGDVFLAAYAALDACLRAAGYEPRAKDTGAYNCRRITGGTGYSLHSYGPADKFTFWNGVKIATALAFDLNWTTNPYGKKLVTDMPVSMRNAIKAIRTNNGKQVWGWGGDYRTNVDAMHWEIVCSPADLATGIDPATVPGYKPPPPPAPDRNAGRPYRTFAAPTDDATIYKVGGRDNQVAEAQILFGVPVTGTYETDDALSDAVVALKKAAKWTDASGALDKSSRIDERFIKAVRALAASG